jgi:hypothetical protein
MTEAEWAAELARATRLTTLACAPYGLDPDGIAINLALPVPIGRAVVTANPALKVRDIPDIGGQWVGQVVFGAPVILWGHFKEWWLIETPAGWVSGAYLQRS